MGEKFNLATRLCDCAAKVGQRASEPGHVGPGWDLGAAILFLLVSG